MEIENLPELLFAAHILGALTHTPADEELGALLDLKILKREALTDQELSILLEMAERTKSSKAINDAITAKEFLFQMLRLKNAFDAAMPARPQPEP